MNNTLHSSYLYYFGFSETLKITRDLVVGAIKELDIQDKFDTICYTGFSGSLLGPMIAVELEKFHCGIPKENTPRHSIHFAEGVIGKSVLILDDFVQLGRTFQYIKNKINQNKEGVKINYGFLYYSFIYEATRDLHYQDLLGMDVYGLYESEFDIIRKKYMELVKKHSIFR